MQVSTRKWLISTSSVVLMAMGATGECAEPVSPDMVASAKAEGMLAKVLYVVFTKGVDDNKAPQNVDRTAAGKQHIEYQKKLEKEGVMFAAGPLMATGIPAQGMIVIRASSEAEARVIADADPMHKLGLRTYTLGRWQINEGTVSVRVNFSDGTYEFE